MLTWAQMRELAAAGWTIGAHTVTHSNVALVDPAEAEAEITASRDAIVAAVGAQVCHFCYPNTGGPASVLRPARGRNPQAERVPIRYDLPPWRTPSRRRIRSSSPGSASARGWRK